MKCSDYQKLISDRLDGSLPPAGQRILEAHLKTCQACHLYEQELKTIEVKLRKLPTAEPENLAALEDGLRERLIRVEAESKVRQNKSQLTKLAPVWAAGLFLVMAAFYLLFFNRPPIKDQNLDLATLMSFEDSYLTLTQTINGDGSLQERYNEEILNSIFEEVEDLNTEGFENIEDYGERIINNNNEKYLLTENI